MFKKVCMEFCDSQLKKLTKAMQKVMEHPRKAIALTIACIAVSTILSQIAVSAASLGSTATLGAVVLGVSLSAIASRVL